MAYTDEDHADYMPVFLLEFSRSISWQTQEVIKKTLKSIICHTGNVDICSDGKDIFQINNVLHDNLSNIKLGNNWFADSLSGKFFHYNANITLFDLYGKSINPNDYVLINYKDYETIKDYCCASYNYHKNGYKFVAFNEYAYNMNKD